MTPEAVHQLIEREFDRLSPELQRAARWVRQHGPALALHSMRRAAREAGVSAATMTRLARRLGFDGFETLRAPYVNQLAGGRPVTYLGRARAAQRTSAGSERLAALNALQQANVGSVVALNAAPGIEAAADALLAAPRVHFLGLRVGHGLAFHLHYVYGLLRPNGTLVHDLGGTMADQLAQLRRGEVLVAVSQTPYTRQTVEAVALAQRRGATIVALTDAALSPIARGAHHVLLYDTASTSFFQSVVGAQALAEALLATVAARGGKAVLERLRDVQEQLRTSRAYWERPRTAAV